MENERCVMIMNFRAILGTLTVEQVYQDRDVFAKAVRDTASPDVGMIHF